ncbi:MAG: acyl-CoA dehydrogenase family protein [Candidatus Limnocylindria bacterium]
MTVEAAGRAEAAAAAGGGSFMIGPVQAASVFTPERLSDEHRAIREAVAAFVAKEVGPRRAEVEGRDHGTHRALLEQLGRDGYLGIDVPEAYGGAGLDRISSVVVNEAIATAGSFAVTYSAHTGIGTLPTVFFGTDEQKRRYLPGLADGTRVGAYALTEPAAGSDAMGIRTRATRQPDGSWRLDGSKQFITNAAFADLFTVYAKIDGEAFSAFLVERSTPGLSIGAEEEKMGLHGCSTCPVTLDGVVVPADNLLGEAGKGHRVAFNVLNVGRFKLAAACLGGMRPALGIATGYAAERTAFGRRLAEFPLIGAKLSAIAARTYAVESTVYRIAGLLEASLAAAEDASSPDAIRAALEEYAIECSIAKVLASEELAYVVDELVQVHGGYGYIEEYPAAGYYRDARIHRIWEGTNEINRLLVPGTLLKRAMTGRLDLLGPARRAQEALLGGDPPSFDGAFAAEDAAVAAARTATLLLAGAAVQRHGTGLEEQQEILSDLADLTIDLFAMESSVERAKQAAEGAAASVHADLARLVVADRSLAIEGRGRQLAASLAEGDEARTLVAGIRRLLRGEPVDRIAIGRRVAAAVVGRGGYPA